MRFSELQLIRYGRFADCTLAFPAGDCDLQIILGPNEAGKSTTLAAVGDLLFGFPGRTRYGFKFDQRLLRVGAVIEVGGQQVSVRRRKGNVDTLLAVDESPVDSNLLRPHLAGQTREAFERMFGLNHAELRSGGKLIVEAKDDVGAAIFAAGSGLVRVARLCQDLEAEAAGIWTKGAGDSRRYTAALSDYQAAKAALREAEVRPAAWVKARKALEEAEAELDGLKSARAELLSAQRATQRKQLILGPLAERGLAVAKLDDLGQTPEMSPEAAARLDEAIDAAQTAKTEIELALAEVQRLHADIEAARPSEAVLAVAPEAEALKELKGVAYQGEAKLPVLEAELTAVTREMRSAITEIGWPAEPAEVLKARLPGRPALAEARELIDRRSVIDEQARAAADAVAEATSILERLQKEAGDLPARTEVGPLQILLGELRASGLTQARQQAEKTRVELERLLTAHLRGLAPWVGDAAALRALSPPADEDVEHVLSRIEAAQAEVAAQQQACDREGARLEQLRLELRHAALDHPTPTAQELSAARETREAAWSPLRAQLRGEAELEDPATAVETFEAAVSGADRIADERFAGAEYAGGLAAREREIERCALQRARVEQARDRASADLDAATGEFQGLMDPLGVALSLEAYPAWRDSREGALQHADGLDVALGDLQEAREAEDAARLALHKALGKPEAEPASLQQLLAEADQVVAAAGEAAAKEREVRAKLKAAEESQQRAQRLRDRASEADAAWQNAWRPALQCAGLGAESSLASARTRLDLIETVRGDIESLLDLEARIAAIRSAAETFETRLEGALRQAGLAIGAGRAETYGTLQGACRDALSRAHRVKALEDELNEALARKAAAVDALAMSKAVLAPLLTAADGQEDPGALRAVLARSAEAARLRARIDELEATILSQGEGRTLEAMTEEVSGLDADVLAAEADAIAENLRELNPRIDSRSEARRAAELAFEVLDDRPDAAIAASTMAQARSEMAFQAELYIRKRAEARLLRTMIERYRQEKQGPLLARASYLFSTLTLGVFAGLMVDYEDDAPKLVGVRSDRETLTPVEGMSDGTVDQLYLALRIAAVEDAVGKGLRLPFVADDLFINFDDERAAAGFKVLADLSRKTQVLFFTHHAHLAEVADKALAPAKVSVCGLDREALAPPASEVTVP